MKFTQLLNALARQNGKPDWVKPFDPVAALLTVRRYGRRAESRKSSLPDSKYAAYLITPHWKQFRMAVLVLSGGQCCRCGDVADHVHHLHYKTVGREALADVEPLCERCHEDEHGKAGGQ
jgi:5-methylcytosine-specific restriction endonuclease McrA